MDCKTCEHKDCRYYIPPEQAACSGCSIAPACSKYEKVDDSNQLTLSFDE